MTKYLFLHFFIKVQFNKIKIDIYIYNVELKN